MTHCLQSKRVKKVKCPLQKGKTTMWDDFEVGGETKMGVFHPTLPF